MKITIDACTPDDKPVRVTLDTDSSRHIIRNGKDVEFADLSVSDMNYADRLLDSLYDLPIYHDGRVWARHPSTTSFNAWEPAMIEEENNMKTINYKGNDIEISAVRFVYGTEGTVQEGILVHDTTDEYRDGDALYGNGWNINLVNDADDVDSLLASGDGTTYWHLNSDGVYTIDA